MATREGMQLSLQHPARPFDEQTRRLLVSGALFFAFTYVLMSLRAAMLPGFDGRLFKPLRLGAVAAGALTYVVAARHLLRTDARPTVSTILGTTALSVAVAVIFRAGLEQLLDNQVASVGDIVRGGLFWTGYFGFWLMGTLVLFAPVPATAAVRQPAQEAVRAIDHAPSVVAPLTQRPTADSLAWEWLVDTLATDLAARRPADRDAILRHLLQQAGMEELDPLGSTDAAQNARARLVRELLTRT